MRLLSLLAVLLLGTACTPRPAAEVSKARDLATAASVDIMDAPAFLDGAVPGALPARGGHSTADLVADFMELSFALESGRQLPVLSRFEGTVTVAMAGPVPRGATEELQNLIARLRGEAGIDIRPARPGEAAAITIEFVPRARMRKAAPNAACFVVPNVGSLDEYNARRGSAATDWARVVVRRKATVFAPAEGSPQEVRDCLHEEMAQALGPLNDLYRLSDSVFNDDNFHSVLTPFDMMMLRAYYSPALSSGMSRAEVGARIGAIMAGLNPGGGSVADHSATPASWKQAIEGALSGGGSKAARRALADRALTIAEAQGWRDSRLALSHFAIARLITTTDRVRAVQEYTLAARIWRGLPGGAVQAAHVDMQLAAIALASGQGEQVLRFADRAIPVARAAQNMSLLATVQLIKARALDSLGRSAEAERLRLDSAAAARYGFGTESAIRARTREIAALGGIWSRG